MGTPDPFEQQDIQRAVTRAALTAANLDITKVPSSSLPPEFYSSIQTATKNAIAGGATAAFVPTAGAPVQLPITSWPDVQQAAAIATQAIPVPPPEMQIKPASTPASDALGVTQALTTGQSPISAAVQALPDAFTQAAGGPVAKTPLGSLLGVGLGGATTGTGPLPGALGVAAQQLFGTNGVPTPARFPTIRVILELHPSFKRALERTGTSMATNLWGLKPRILGDFRGAFLDLAMMRHEDEFRASLLTLLRELINHVSMGLGSPAPPLSTGLTAPLVLPTPQPSPFQTLQALLQRSAFTPPATPQPSGRIASLQSLLQGSGFAARPAQPLLTGSLSGPPIAAIPVRAAGIVPKTVVPVAAAAAPQVVYPAGMAHAVSGLNAGRRRRWRA